MTQKTTYALVAGLVVLIAAGVAVAVYGWAGPFETHQASPPPVVVKAPATTPPAQAECLLPGPAPVVPAGGTASEADIRLAHDVIQHFVVQLEAYQACLNIRIDHADATVSAAQKQTWVDEGNAAVDQAHELADAFSAQLKLYKAQKPKP